jgi:hypothetical protein
MDQSRHPASADARAAGGRRRWKRLSSGLALLSASLLLSCSDSPSDPSTAVATIDLEPSELTLLVGGTQLVRMLPRDAGGSVLRVGQAQWRSTDTTVVRLVPARDGLMEAVAVGRGSAEIEAHIGALVGRAPVTVEAPPPQIGGLQVAGRTPAAGEVIRVEGHTVELSAVVSVPVGGIPITHVTACRVYDSGSSCGGMEPISIGPGESQRVAMTARVTAPGRTRMALATSYAERWQPVYSEAVELEFVYSEPRMRILSVGGVAVTPGQRMVVGDEIELDVEVTLPEDSPAPLQTVGLWLPTDPERSSPADIQAFTPLQPALQPGQSRTVRIRSYTAPRGEYMLYVAGWGWTFARADSVRVLGTNSDVTPPVIRVLSHADSAVVTDPIITIRYEVEDAQSGVFSEMLTWAYPVPVPGTNMVRAYCGQGTGGLGGTQRLHRIEATRSNTSCGATPHLLQPGPNRIVIEARDNAYNRAADTLTIVYRPPSGSTSSAPPPPPFGPVERETKRELLPDGRVRIETTGLAPAPR